MITQTTSRDQSYKKYPKLQTWTSDAFSQEQKQIPKEGHTTNLYVT